MKNSKRFEWNANYLISQIFRKREQLENGKVEEEKRWKVNLISNKARTGPRSAARFKLELHPGRGYSRCKLMKCHEEQE